MFKKFSLTRIVQRKKKKGQSNLQVLKMNLTKYDTVT